MKKYMCIILSLVLCFFLCCSCSDDSEEISEEVYATTEQLSSVTENTEEPDLSQYSSLDEEIGAYLKYDGLSDYAEYSQTGYYDIVTDLYFMDIDDDGIYELLRCLHFNYPEGGHIIYLYDYIDGQVVYLGKTDGGAVEERYRDFYENPDAKSWVINEPIKLYKDSNGESFKYLTCCINAGNGFVYFNFIQFSIINDQVSSKNLNIEAYNNFRDDDAIAYKDWYYNFGDSSTDLENEFTEFLNNKLEGYEQFKPEKPTLYTQLECNEWRNKDINNDEIAKNIYENCIKDAIENIR